MKRYYINAVLVLLALSFLMISCGKDDQALSAPSIISLSPDTGVAGTEVTIFGENFGIDRDVAEVTFGTKTAEITGINDTELSVNAPSGFNNAAFDVTVAVSGRLSNSKTFTYRDMTPVITGLSPGEGGPGSVITISGNRLGDDPSDVRVRFDATDATNLVSVTDTAIVVEAPAGFSDQTVDVTVLVGDLASNSLEFYYEDTTPPVITSVPEYCFYTAVVVINGSNFSPNKENNRVMFGSAEAMVTAASTSSLTVITPDLGTATSTDITVTKFGVVSNARTIAVDADQSKVAAYEYTTHTIRSGIIYKTGQFTLFGDVQRRIYILDVTLDASNTLGIGFSATNAATVTMCRSYDAVAGVNAGYFPMGSSTDKDPYIRINGITVQAGHLNVNRIFTNSALLVHDNVATVRKFTESGKNLNLVAAAIPVAEAENVIVCGPMLIHSGRIENLDMSSSHNSSLTGRTGIGVSADGKRIYMVVVDTGGSVTGVNTWQLAKILQALGAVNAMNFDGGGSSTMFVRDQGENGRVNFPYGGTYQRPVRSVIYVK